MSTSGLRSSTPSLPPFDMFQNTCCLDPEHDTTTFSPFISSLTATITTTTTTLIGQDMGNTLQSYPAARPKKRSTSFFSLPPSCFPGTGRDRSKSSKPARVGLPNTSRRTSSFSWLPPKSKLTSIIVGTSGFGAAEDDAGFDADQESAAAGAAAAG